MCVCVFVVYVCVCLCVCVCCVCVCVFVCEFLKNNFYIPIILFVSKESWVSMATAMWPGGMELNSNMYSAMSFGGGIPFLLLPRQLERRVL